jgi:hypothetical protein
LWCMPVIPVLKRLGWECQFKANLSYMGMGVGEENPGFSPQCCKRM